MGLAEDARYAVKDRTGQTIDWRLRQLQTVLGDGPGNYGIEFASHNEFRTNFIVDGHRFHVNRDGKVYFWTPRKQLCTNVASFGDIGRALVDEDSRRPKERG